MYTCPRGESVSEVLMSSSAYKAVLENNVDFETSFNKIDISINKIMEEPNTALFYEDTSIKSRRKYRCKVSFCLINSISNIICLKLMYQIISAYTSLEKSFSINL